MEIQSNMKPTIGIIGGSGPLATLDIEKKILSANLRLTSPLIDQDYFNLVVFNYSGTYDRNDSVVFGRSDPLTQYNKYITSISALDVDLILLACNTAHIYLPALQEKTKIPIISIIEATANCLREKHPKCSKVGLISTKATQEKRLYHNLLSRYDIEVVNVESSTQDSLMEAIYLIKAGVGLAHEEASLSNIRNRISNIKIEQARVLKNHPYKQILLQEKFPSPSFIVKEAIEELKRKKCQHIIFGCTELPLVIPYLKKESDLHFIDPNSIIAEAVVETLIDLENQTWKNIKVLSNERRYR